MFSLLPNLRASPFHMYENWCEDDDTFARWNTEMISLYFIRFRYLRSLILLRTLQRPADSLDVFQPLFSAIQPNESKSKLQISIFSQALWEWKYPYRSIYLYFLLGIICCVEQSKKSTTKRDDGFPPSTLAEANRKNRKKFLRMREKHERTLIWFNHKSS